MKYEDVEKARVALLEKQKRLRKKALMICAPIFAVLIIVIIVEAINNSRFGVFVLASIMPLIVAGIIVLVISAIVVGIMTNKETVAFKRAYKGYFVSRQLEKFFTDIKYDHEKGLEREILKNTSMIHTGDRYYSNDLVCAKYKNVDFMQADVTVQDEHEDSDGDTSYVTVFKGRYMIFEFPKKFNFKMMVVPKWSSHEYSRNLKHIEVESTEFNKDFQVYAEDGFEAFYLLDPAFIASMEDLSAAYNKHVSLYFADNKLIIGINNGDDSFEPPKPNMPIDEKAELEKNYKDIKVITDFVDNLRLDRDKVK